MCATCGCPAPEPSEHGLAASSRRLAVQRRLLARNDVFAAENRRYLEAKGILALNLVSGPGSGKTSLLTATLERLAGRLPVAVLEGDPHTSRDADRIRAAGAPAVQINTGQGCHLDARGVGRALRELALPDGALLFIENVGNLVCPALFDLGERHRVVILSVPEGEDKPLKYPDLFASASLMLLHKVDLLPHLAFDPEACLAFARRSNPRLPVIATSARSGVGLAAWVDWLMVQCRPRVA